MAETLLPAAPPPAAVLRPHGAAPDPDIDPVPSPARRLAEPPRGPADNDGSPAAPDAAASPGGGAADVAGPAPPLPPPPPAALVSEPSMHDVSLLMRAQDAELLESLHHHRSAHRDGGDGEDEDSDGAAPPRAPPPLLPAEAERGEEEAADAAAAAAPRSVISRHSHYRSPRAREPRKTVAPSAATARTEGAVPAEAEEEDDESLRRRALSGEVYRSSSRLSATEGSEDDAAATDQETTAAAAGDEAGTVPGDRRPRRPRTESFARRVNEAQQFADAVGGDIHPNEQDQLRIIEDDDGHDDYSDDDDNDGHRRIVCLPPPEEDQPGAAPPAEAPTDPTTGVPPGALVRRKSRPAWPFGTATKRGFMDKLPDRSTQQDFVYKGIRANPPNVVKRGTDRGNYAQLHRKAWLEVSDKYHRYGKHLRVYYRHWESLGCPHNMFFDWLDSKGEAAGQPLPNLEECPRSELDSDTVLYITNDEVTHGYALSFSSDDCGRGRVFDIDGDPVQTGPDGWIFVLRDNVMYGAQKITSVQGKSKQRFHHSSFFGGKAVAAAGIFVTDDEGYLTCLYPHSGHYRPGDAHMQRMLFFLLHEGIDLRTFEMDIQQIQHVARDMIDVKKDTKGTDGGEKTDKKKKVETLMLVPAVEVACYLAHKARFIGENIFSQIHQIRASGATTVTEALAAIEESKN